MAEVQGEQSTVLTEGEVTAVVEGETPVEEAILPSEKAAFEMPEKFQGKTAEEIAQSYLDLEKFKATTEEPPTEEPKEETKEEPKAEEVEKYNEYKEHYDKNGELTEAQYAELAEKGYTKAQVDAEIKRVGEEAEYTKYKQEKVLNDVLAPFEGGVDKFKEVSKWAHENKTAEEVAEFNAALKGAGKLAQQALLKSLYADYAAGNVEDVTLHTNSPQQSTTKGYATESDFFKDISSESYQTDKSYVARVEAKLAKSDTTQWSF